MTEPKNRIARYYDVASLERAADMYQLTCLCERAGCDDAWLRALRAICEEVIDAACEGK